MDEENILVKRYGLKNKREIWKAKTAVSKLRRRAKTLIGKEQEEQKGFFDKLIKMGIIVRDVSDVLALTEENLFERRLQTVLFKKKMANTVKAARQLIVHKNVLVDGKVVNIPSFIVTSDLEDKISLKERKVKVKSSKDDSGDSKVEESVEEGGVSATDDTDSEEKVEGNAEETKSGEVKK